MTRKTQRHHRSYEQKDDQPITPVEYGGLQQAFDHFDAALFEGKLPDCFITYQRKAHSFGYFSADRFSGRIGKFGKHELALNPDAFIGQSDQQICQTLVHEMVHLKQHAFGKPSARGYHNKEWAAMMKAIGLQPSNTGAVGGKETGQHMADYIIPNAAFATAFARLATTGWKLNLQSAHRPGPQGGTNSKTKFTCPACGQNAWGKPDLAILCKPCGADMIASAPMVEPTPEPVPSYEPKPQHETPTCVIEPCNAAAYDQTLKRKPGRPKGSKNKPKRGRPKGGKNRLKAPETVSAISERDDEKAGHPGRAGQRRTSRQMSGSSEKSARAGQPDGQDTPL